MKLKKHEKMVISMFLEDFTKQFMSDLGRLEELVQIIELDRDDEYALIDKGIHTLRTKMKTINKPKRLSDITDNVKMKKVLTEAKKTGGYYNGK